MLGDTPNALNLCSLREASLSSPLNGDIASKTYLGMMYYYGQGVVKDTNIAFKMLSEAVGDKSVLSAKAMRVLSACYRYGLGTQKDAEKEKYWMEEAAKYNDKKAISILERE